MKAIEHALSAYGVSPELCNKLLSYGERPLIAWLAQEHVKNKRHTLKQLLALSEQSGIPYLKIWSAYYSFMTVPIEEVKKDRCYAKIRKEVEHAYPTVTMWDVLASYRYSYLVKLAAESMITRKVPAAEVQKTTGITTAMYYRLLHTI